MAQALPFFKFVIAGWMMGRIQKQPEQMQGFFINLCCKYWHKMGKYDYEDACSDFDKKKIDRLIEAKIIKLDQKKLLITFLDEQLIECEEFSQKQSQKGLKSAQKRAEIKQRSTTVEPRLTSDEQRSTIESENENIEKNESDRRETSCTLGTGKHYIVITQKYVGDTAYRIQGSDGLKQYFELNGSSINFPDWTDRYMRDRNSKPFNEFQHVWNDFDKYVKQQFK